MRLTHVRGRATATSRRTGVALCVMTLLVGLLAGCSMGERTAGTVTKSGDGVQRSDTEPLVSRIPALTGVQSVTWYSGTLGDPDAPGPSLYWIDAVVVLPEGVADELRGTLELTPALDQPGAVDALAPHLPAGTLLVGAQLDEAFSADGWRSTAYLSQDSDQLVLVVVGQ